MIKTLLCDKWEFSLNEFGTEYENADGWKEVDLPHDWLIEDTHDLYKTSTGWYRRHIKAEADNMLTCIRFEGVYMDCAVYVNGAVVFEWKYGYTTFEVDITDHLTRDDNLICVRVNHKEPNSRWYSGAGIFRNVYMIRRDPLHFPTDGIYVSAKDNGDVTVMAETLRPEDMDVTDIKVRISLLDKNGAVCAVKEASVNCADLTAVPAALHRKGYKHTLNEFRMHIDDVHLWDISDTYMYSYKAELICADEVKDTQEGRFGIRNILFTTDKGFFLNGRHIKLHGCCEHHDLGALGSAFNKIAFRRKLNTLRTMGINAIRTSHNPPAVEVLELADEMGFLIVDECFDMWELKKTDYDYARFFKEWVDKDVASWIRRDRNHPCIIAWSIGNEIYDTAFSDRGQEITSELKHLVRLHDYNGNAYVTIGSNHMANEKARRCADIVKLAGYNYAERLYDEQHAEHPDWMMYGSETSSIVSSRGIYHFPLSEKIVTEDDEQCSAFGNGSPIWASKCWEWNLINDRDRDYIAGQFIWTGFDYIGEPTPYATKNSYFGQIDTAGFPKDGYYVYKSVWTDEKSAPFVHIFPYWDFNKGEMIDIRVASNTSKVELYFNGILIASECFDRSSCDHLTMDAQVSYEEGELIAVGYDKDGNELCRDLVKSFTDATNIKAVPDKTVLNAGGDDLIFIDISACDKDGIFVANACDRINVKVSGAGRLVGLDNGDSTDFEQYKAMSRRLFSGKLLAIIAPVKESGRIEVQITSPSLKGETLVFDSIGGNEISGMSFIASNHEFESDYSIPSDKDIPIRKLEFAPGKREFDADNTDLEFEVKVLPENASYDDITYRITTVNGIDCVAAQIAGMSGNKVRVHCLGDGDFYLRAMAANGAGKVRLISMIHLSASGLGNAYINPYEFVLGGLFSISGGYCSNGIEHGAAFGAGGGYFGFENVDFGMVGSDEITIPLFANYSTPIRIAVWDGAPDKGGECLDDYEYSVPPIWMTYQPVTYKLPKMLRGIHTICIQSDFAYDCKGFVFKENPKECSNIYAAYATEIYGDTFTKEEEAVTGIGNNVILSFGEFDYTKRKLPSKLVICGKSELPNNSIQVQLEDENGNVIRMSAEFAGASEYTERCFDLSNVPEKLKLSFIFLPGCKFDFNYFRFE